LSWPQIYAETTQIVPLLVGGRGESDLFGLFILSLLLGEHWL
jgi:hypothetical protein